MLHMRRHARLVVCIRPALGHTMPNNGHDLLFAAERCHRVAIPQGLGVRRQVRLEIVVFLRAAVCDTEAGLDFIQDEHTSIFLGLLADELQKAVLWIDRRAVALARLGDHGCDLFAIRAHDPLETFEVIKWKRDDELPHGLRDTRGSRNRDGAAPVPIGFHRRIGGPKV